MIAALPLGVFLVILLLLAVMAGAAVFAGLQARKRAALVAGTPTTPIGMATDGYREFEGKVEAVAGPTVTAPLTRWPCCWYHARVEKWEVRRTGSDDTRTRSWALVWEWTSGAPFFVRDASGVCIVDPYGAEVTPTDKSMWYGATAEPSDRNPARVGPTESAKGAIEVSGTPGTQYRYSEERIYAGDPLLVLGEFWRGGEVRTQHGRQRLITLTPLPADPFIATIVSVRMAVAGTALAEVGAIGLGAAVTALATTTFADVTGILAAGALAVIGLFVIPVRRKQAKAAMREKIEGMRAQLVGSLTSQFDREVERSVGRVRDAIAPYTRFVRAEQQRLGGTRDELRTLAQELGALQRRIDELPARR